MKKRPDYRQELVLAAELAAARILIDAKTGARFPHHETVKLLRQAWLDGHAAAKKEQKSEYRNEGV